MKVSKELLKGSTEILILSILSRGDMYGYGMIKEIEKQSRGVFKFKEGTLYPILHSLESAGNRIVLGKRGKWVQAKIL